MTSSLTCRIMWQSSKELYLSYRWLYDEVFVCIFWFHCCEILMQDCNFFFIVPASRSKRKNYRSCKHLLFSETHAPMSDLLAFYFPWKETLVDLRQTILSDGQEGDKGCSEWDYYTHGLNQEVLDTGEFYFVIKIKEAHFSAYHPYGRSRHPLWKFNRIFKGNSGRQKEERL